jgi:ammonia channel protein AmtB
VIFAAFAQQVSLTNFTLDVFYALASVCLFLVVVAFGLIDHGLVRGKNTVDTWVQKLISALVSGLAFIFIGYGIWNWQFNQAFGVANPLGEAIKAWWLGGSNFLHTAQNLDPKVTPQADVYQVFAVFFIAYAAAIGALIHSAAVERIKPAAIYIISAIAGGIMMPFMAYLTWGSTSVLTNLGVHDYLGDFSLYIFFGMWALILAWRLGPRLGSTLRPDSRTTGPAPQNLGISAAGVGVLMFAIPFLALGCGYFIPGQGYFGIAMSSSGVGIVLVNIFVAFGGGALTGLAIAYYKKSSLMALIGPIAGYISGAAGFDVFKPWEMLIVSMFGPLVVYFGYWVVGKLKIDESKVIGLTLFGGTYSAIVTGFVAWHVKDGGFFGLTGTYGFQHAQITPLWQLVGVGATIGAAIVTGVPLFFLLEKTIGLRVSEEQEIAGLDQTYWPAPAPARATSVEGTGTGSTAPVAGGVPLATSGDATGFTPEEPLR